MKIFEVTQLSESPELAAQVAQKILARHKQISSQQDGTTTTTSQSTKTVTKTGGGSTTTKTDAPEYTAAQQNQDDIDATNAEIDQEIADAKAAGDTARVAELEKEKASLAGGNLMKPAAGNEMPIEAVAKEIKSGAAKLSKDIDAELGKRGANPKKVHLAVFQLMQSAGRNYARKFNKENGITKKAALMNIKKAKIQIRAAGYGYINKKYLGGSADNFSGNGRELVAQVLQSQAPKGKSQPIGKVSSARPAGASGVVPSGGGTNALDAIAARTQGS